jgi:hypothetical protein
MVVPGMKTPLAVLPLEVRGFGMVSPVDYSTETTQ